MTSVTFPRGFRGSGISAQIKSNGHRDLALIVNDGPQQFGTAVFTTNRIVAAPVTWSKEVVKDQIVAAVLLNSGGANACTGPEGFLDTHRSAEKVALTLGVSASDVVVCSTGLIGTRLPMDLLLNGITFAAGELAGENGYLAAEAIMTTDSHPKFFEADFSGVRIFGMAKGAGMLAPGLATMLSVITIDAMVDEANATEIFARVTEQTFNRIDSDGCMSTNDTVLLMASGASGVELSSENLEYLLRECCSNLAQQLIHDAEGHSKIVEIKVVNASSEKDAVSVARACARNNLLKCALHGEDPNWGRVLAAVGTADAVFDPYQVDVALNGVWVCISSAPGADRALVDMTAEKIEIVVDLHAGEVQASVWTNDLTAMYVHENSSYSS